MLLKSNIEILYKSCLTYLLLCMYSNMPEQSWTYPPRGCESRGRSSHRERERNCPGPASPCSPPETATAKQFNIRACCLSSPTTHMRQMTAKQHVHTHYTQDSSASTSLTSSSRSGSATISTPFDPSPLRKTSTRRRLCSISDRKRLDMCGLVDFFLLSCVQIKPFIVHAQFCERLLWSATAICVYYCRWRQNSVDMTSEARIACSPDTSRTLFMYC